MANIPAATSSITRLAALSERMRNTPSRMSGWVSRSSSTTNVASSTAATPARPRVWPEVHPTRSALTRAYTSTISPVVIAKAPPTSTPRPALVARLSGT